AVLKQCLMGGAVGSVKVVTEGMVIGDDEVMAQLALRVAGQQRAACLRYAAADACQNRRCTEQLAAREMCPGHRAFGALLDLLQHRHHALRVHEMGGREVAVVGVFLLRAGGRACCDREADGSDCSSFDWIHYEPPSVDQFFGTIASGLADTGQYPGT